MSAYNIQTPGNYPEENIQHTEDGESLKSRRLLPSSCPTVHIKQLVLRLMDFPENLYWGFFAKTCQENSSSLKIGQKKANYPQACVHL